MGRMRSFALNSQCARHISAGKAQIARCRRDIGQSILVFQTDSNIARTNGASVISLHLEWQRPFRNRCDDICDSHTQCARLFPLRPQVFGWRNGATRQVLA